MAYEGTAPLLVANGGTGRTTLTNHGVLVGAATGAITQLAAGTSGQVLQSGGASSDPAYSTATYPGTASTNQQFLMANGTNWTAKTFSINVQVFTSSGTYTPTSGMIYCIMECVGSGAGGGGCASSATLSSAGGGGGAGGYSKKFASAATVGGSQTVTVNAAGTGGTAGNNPGTDGGSVSIGAICIANGGTHGNGAAAGTGANGGAGGNAGTGDVTATGEAGGVGVGASTFEVVGAAGGNSIWGAGGQGQVGTGAATGSNGRLYGGGGAGGLSGVNAGTAAGGNGALGIAIVTEYIWA